VLVLIVSRGPSNSKKPSNTPPASFVTENTRALCPEEIETDRFSLTCFAAACISRGPNPAGKSQRQFSLSYPVARLIDVCASASKPPVSNAQACKTWPAGTAEVKYASTIG